MVREGRGKSRTSCGGQWRGWPVCVKKIGRGRGRGRGRDMEKKWKEND